MKLKLLRKYLKDTYTIGHLYIDDVYFCDVLEDKVRDINHDGVNEQMVFGQTAIPYGTYPIILNYSPKFKQTMPRLQNIKGYEGVLIHSGNTKEDTLGCLLVGENKVVGKVINSKITYNKLFEKLSLVWSNGEKIEIEII